MPPLLRHASPHNTNPSDHPLPPGAYGGRPSWLPWRSLEGPGGTWRYPGGTPGGTPGGSPGGAPGWLREYLPEERHPPRAASRLPSCTQPHEPRGLPKRPTPLELPRSSLGGRARIRQQGRSGRGVAPGGARTLLRGPPMRGPRHARAAAGATVADSAALSTSCGPPPVDLTSILTCGPPPRPPAAGAAAPPRGRRRHAAARGRGDGRTRAG